MEPGEVLLLDENASLRTLRLAGGGRLVVTTRRVQFCRCTSVFRFRLLRLYPRFLRAAGEFEVDIRDVAGTVILEKSRTAMANVEVRTSTKKVYRLIVLDPEQFAAAVARAREARR